MIDGSPTAVPLTLGHTLTLDIIELEKSYILNGYRQKQDQNESNTTGSSTSALPTTQRPDWMSPVQPTERRIEASTLSGLPTTKRV